MSFPFAPAVADSAVFSLPKAKKQIKPHRVQIFKIFPIQAYLIGQIHAGIFIVQPIQINIEQDDDGSYVISDDLFLVYGSGDDQSNAIEDYIESLIEFYRLVKKNAATNPFDQKLLAFLQTYIQSKPLRGYDAIQTNRD